MKAKLVTITITRRVVVPDNAIEEQIIKQAIDKIRELDDYEIAENLDSIIEDDECPYDAEFDGDETIGETAEYSINISGSGKREDIINEL